jgi:hypothetical protein
VGKNRAVPDEVVRRIRARLTIGDKQEAIAHDEGVSRAYVSLVGSGRLRAGVRPSAYLTWEDVARKSLTCESCGANYGVSRRRYTAILRDNWKCPRCGCYGWSVR